MEELADIPWELIAPLIVIQALLMLVAVIDIFRNGETKGPKWMWVAIVVVLSLVGPIAYFIAGRKQS